MANLGPHSHAFDRSRRRFLYGISAGVLAPPAMAWIGPGAPSPSADFEVEAASLLRNWCDGLLRQQIHDPAQPSRDGALDCPACRRIHGRCGDAILPLLAMAARSGEMRYRDAALGLWKWMKNVDSPDGAWTNEPDPKSWKGTTVFSAIALVESLEWHADLLDAETQSAMRSRLAKAGEYIKKNFNTEFGNINYAAAGALALSGLGKLLDSPQFTQRGDELAQQVLAFFTPKDRLLFGEGKPANQRSPKGCYPVDLGYNVAESLPSLIHYALTAKVKDVLDVAVESLKAHMHFMLPDGGWDNSWGTRSFKWTYWGSRTADGVLSVLVRLAGQEPAFGAAAWRSLRLVRDCTRDGLLLGGPHYADHGVPACVHHTFVHAKTVAGALHYLSKPMRTETIEVAADGVRHFPELDVYLLRNGPWRASFSGYDWFYRPNLKQATGGTAGMVWHAQLGPLLAAGLAEYVPVEEHNLQALPKGCEEPVSCRIEYRSSDGELYSNLFDAAAVLMHDGPRITVRASLVSRVGATPAGGAFKVLIEYLFAQDSLTITVRPEFIGEMPWSLVVPVISRKSEKVVAQSDRQWEIHKPGGTLVVDSSKPIEPSKLAGERAFSLCPGFQVLPLRISSNDRAAVSCKLTFRR